MKQKTFILIVLATLITIISCNYRSDNDSNRSTAKTEKLFDSINLAQPSKLDTATLTDIGFYKLSADDNRTLWYRDIESPNKTKFTGLWNDYSQNNYHASQTDFVKYYENKKDVVLAFQFGPNYDLWAYDIFVVKNIDSCYLITHSYFRHARFTYKSYSYINENTLNRLCFLIGKIKQSQIGTDEISSYCGYFVDNKNHKKFFVDFDKESIEVMHKDETITKEPKKEILKLYDFIDKKINWIKTYDL